MPSTPSTPAPPPVANRRQRVQSAETGMAVLKGLARLGGRAGLTVLAAHIGESPAKVHRYLSSLIEEGLVAQDGNSQYHLDTEAIQIGLAALRQADPIRLAETSLARLREQLGVTCFLAVMGNKGPTIVRFEEPALPVTVNVRVGSVLSLVWSASGRVFLGLLDERGVRDMADAEIASASPAMRARLPAEDPVATLQREVRAAGCSIVRDVYLPGISAVSAPIRDAAGRVCGVITALGASGGFDTTEDGPIACAVRREAGETSSRLGCAATRSPVP